MLAMTIGQVARQAGVGVETVRFHEHTRLLTAPPRGESGYRQYSQDVIRRIQFITRAKDLGFSLKDISELLFLRVDSDTTCAEVKERAEAKIADIDTKLRDRQRMKEALAQLVAVCSGQGPTSHRPILDALEPHDDTLDSRPNPLQIREVSMCPTFDVKGMHCEGCESRIKTALQQYALGLSSWASLAVVCGP